MRQPTRTPISRCSPDRSLRLTTPHRELRNGFAERPKRETCFGRSETHKTMALVEYQDDLFGGDRSSSIPVGLFVKFEVSRENRDKANLARMQRLERDRIRQEKAELQYQTTQERRAKVLQRSGQSKALMQRHNQDTGREVRACKRRGRRSAAGRSRCIMRWQRSGPSWRGALTASWTRSRR